MGENGIPVACGVTTIVDCGGGVTVGKAASVRMALKVGSTPPVPVRLTSGKEQNRLVNTRAEISKINLG